MKKYSLVSSAVDNEVEIEKFFYKKKGVDPKTIGFFPKLSRFEFFFSGYILRYLAILFSFFWPVVQFFYNFILLLYFLLYKFLFLMKGGVDYSLFKYLLFSSGVSAPEIVGKVVVDPILILCRPSRARKERGSDSGNYLDSLSVIGFGEIVVVFFSAIINSIIFFVCHEKKEWRVLSFIFYEYLLAARALEKVSGKNEFELYSVDHFDRWAILADFMAGSGFFKSLTIVQHGVLRSESKGSLDVFIPCKLKNVDVLFLFDQESKDLFFSDVLADDAKTIIKYFDNYIDLLSESESESEIVLIIGNDLCLGFHLELFFRMKNEFYGDFTFIYKPHPTQIVSSAVRNAGWKVLTDSRAFPDANLIISYPSSLSFQYAKLGRLVIEHSIDCDTGCISSVLDQVRAKISLGGYGGLSDL